MREILGVVAAIAASLENQGVTSRRLKTLRKDSVACHFAFEAPLLIKKRTVAIALFVIMNIGRVSGHLARKRQGQHSALSILGPKGQAPDARLSHDRKIVTIGDAADTFGVFLRASVCLVKGRCRGEFHREDLVHLILPDGIVNAQSVFSRVGATGAGAQVRNHGQEEDRADGGEEATRAMEVHVAV